MKCFERHYFFFGLKNNAIIYKKNDILVWSRRVRSNLKNDLRQLIVIKMKALYERVLKKITPTKKEVLAEKKLVEEIMQRVKKMGGKHSHIEWCGSSARGTHLRGDKDIDLFIMFDKKLPKSEFEREGLRIGKAIFNGERWEMAYSQHPYIRGKIKGFDVEIVPSYIVECGEKKQSAVDRTPFHNKYLLKKLSGKQRQEVRLLKQFLKGINAYGADLKNCSLPGYGVELLITKYKTFNKATSAISKWKKGEIITFENQTKENARVLFEREKCPLILIDPVDSKRNVASALSNEQFQRIVLAAKLFSQKPVEKFFFPKRTKIWSKEKVREVLSKKEIIAIQGHFPKKILSDLVWGQLRRFEKKCATHLREKDFVVMQSGLWSDEEEVVFLYELNTLNLQKAKKIVGPMVSDWVNVMKFLEKKRKIISGPRIEGARIVLEIERDETSAKKILEEFIKKQLKEEKSAIKFLLKKARVLSEREILFMYKKKFAIYLTNYLEGKESFER